MVRGDRGCQALGTASTLPPAAALCHLPLAARTLRERLRGPERGEEVRKPVSPRAAHHASSRSAADRRQSPKASSRGATLILPSSPVTPVTPAPATSVEHCPSPGGGITEVQTPRSSQGGDHRATQGHPAVGDPHAQLLVGVWILPPRSRLARSKHPAISPGAGTTLRVLSPSACASGSVPRRTPPPWSTRQGSAGRRRAHEGHLPPRGPAHPALRCEDHQRGGGQHHPQPLAGAGRQLSPALHLLSYLFSPPRAPRSERGRVGGVGC